MSSFSAAHRLYVKSLYRRFLTNELDWVVNRQEWRARAMNVRAEFERNRNVHDPRALAVILEKAEAYLAEHRHPDRYIPPSMPDGTKWELPLPPSSYQPPIEPIFDHEAHGHH
ncbi:hypothetical protein BDM02DRAFT_3154152 [Thelephora ganbajun]|uniref:Uncharacterized protein n=1 Tax=Thelephora ganbajun TaxID=370292 RepID=A0ACB6ZPK2_THEGA|nr:hypothetical protein BDM02DRAFT_3154152 [Thelephora ganbajun]